MKKAILFHSIKRPSHKDICSTISPKMPWILEALLCLMGKKIQGIRQMLSMKNCLWKLRAKEQQSSSASFIQWGVLLWPLHAYPCINTETVTCGWEPLELGLKSALIPAPSNLYPLPSFTLRHEASFLIQINVECSSVTEPTLIKKCFGCQRALYKMDQLAESYTLWSSTEWNLGCPTGGNTFIIGTIPMGLCSTATTGWPASLPDGGILPWMQSMAVVLLNSAVMLRIPR